MGDASAHPYAGEPDRATGPQESDIPGIWGDSRARVFDFDFREGIP